LRKTTGAVLLLFVVLSLVLTYPIPFHLANAVEDRQDALLNVWITAWDGHQLLTDPLNLFDANIFYPYPRTLAYSELLLGNGLLALPITAITGNPVLGYNVALLLSFVLSGFGIYLLVLSLTRSPGAGLVAGVVFAYSAYRMTNLAQAQLLITQWMPFALLPLCQLMHHPRPRHAGILVLFFCLQALSSFYYAILLALVVGGFVVWTLALRPAPRSPKTLLYLLLAAVCCALVILPFALPYFQVQRDLGFERTLADSEPFSASLRQYLMVPPGSVLHGRWLPSDDTPIVGGYPVDALFPGLVTLALAAWGLIRGQSRARWFFLLLLLVAFCLSLGPRLYLAPGQPAALDARLPYAWLYALVPGFKALRAPARFDALVMLSLAVLAGYGVAALEGVLSGRRPWLGRVGIPVLLAGLVVLESLVWPAASAEPVPVGDDVPPLYRWLADQPPGPILELPMAFTAGAPKLEYQYLSTYHWRSTPDGYSGFIPPKHGQVLYELERFPSERSVSLLQALGVRTVVVHTDRYPPDQWFDMQSVLAQVSDLTPVETLGADQVFQVQPRSFDPGVLEIGGYLPPQAVAGQPYTGYAIAVNNGARSYAVQPTNVLGATAVWESDGGSMAADIAASLPLVTSPNGGAAVIPLPLMAPATPGTWRLVIEGQDGVLGEWRVDGLVEVGDQAGAGFPVPAQLATWAILPMVRPGDSLPVALTWRALGKIDAYYSVYVKLLDAKGNAVAGWDGQPRDGDAPTLLWVPGETIDDVVSLAIPTDIPPGNYTVEVGMYRVKDLARCLTLNGDGVPVESVPLGTVHVQP
jgi:hypothetical protein